MHFAKQGESISPGKTSWATIISQGLLKENLTNFTDSYTLPYIFAYLIRLYLFPFAPVFRVCLWTPSASWWSVTRWEVQAQTARFVLCICWDETRGWTVYISSSLPWQGLASKLCWPPSPLAANFFAWWHTVVYEWSISYENSCPLVLSCLRRRKKVIFRYLEFLGSFEV